MTVFSFLLTSDCGSTEIGKFMSASLQGIVPVAEFSNLISSYYILFFSDSFKSTRLEATAGDLSFKIDYMGIESPLYKVFYEPAIVFLLSFSEFSGGKELSNETALIRVGSQYVGLRVDWFGVCFDKSGVEF